MTYVIESLVVIGDGKSSFRVSHGRRKTVKKEENGPIAVFAYQLF